MHLGSPPRRAACSRRQAAAPVPTFFLKKRKEQTKAHALRSVVAGVSSSSFIRGRRGATAAQLLPSCRRNTSSTAAQLSGDRWRANLPSRHPHRELSYPAVLSRGYAQSFQTTQPHPHPSEDLADGGTHSPTTPLRTVASPRASAAPREQRSRSAPILAGESAAPKKFASRPTSVSKSACSCS
jgi:hypothetical protein